jgi:hypothetical protein
MTWLAYKKTLPDVGRDGFITSLGLTCNSL